MLPEEVTGIRAPIIIKCKGHLYNYALQLALNSLVGLSLVGLSHVCLLNVVLDHFSTASGVCSVSIGATVHHTHPQQAASDSGDKGSGVLVNERTPLATFRSPGKFCSLLIVSKKKSFK